MSLDHFEPYEIRVCKVRAKNEERRQRRETLNGKSQEEHTVSKKAMNGEANQSDIHRASNEKHPIKKEAVSEKEGVTETVQKFTDLREKLNQSRKEKKSIGKGCNDSSMTHSDAHRRSTAHQNGEPHCGYTDPVGPIDKDGRSPTRNFRTLSICEQEEDMTQFCQLQFKQREGDYKRDANVSNGNLQVKINLESNREREIVGYNSLPSEKPLQRKISIVHGNKEDDIENKSSKGGRGAAWKTKDSTFKKTCDTSSVPSILHAGSKLKKSMHSHSRVSVSSEREWDRGKTWNEYFGCFMSEIPLEEEDTRALNWQHGNKIINGSSSGEGVSNSLSRGDEVVWDQGKERIKYNECYTSNGSWERQNVRTSDSQHVTEIFYLSPTNEGLSKSLSRVQNFDPSQNERDDSDNEIA